MTSNAVDDAFEAQLQRMRQSEYHHRQDQVARRWLWLSHHWPHHYHNRCFQIAGRPVCRRCSALYPSALIVTVLSLAWPVLHPGRFDWPVIWLLCLPATVAYVGEARGVFPYRWRWQVLAMLITSVGFGRALAHQIVDTWSPVFWAPLIVFGTIWLAATVTTWRPAPPDRPRPGPEAPR